MAKRKSKSHAKTGKSSTGQSQNDEKKTNPFEIRINKRRYDILGRKTKHEQGRPGVSRSKGLKKREKTLLVEYKHRNKVNTFIDKRFGEYDENLSLEEKMLKRFATEKQRHHEKSGLFNLEDEDLTHFGQSLDDIKQFGESLLTDEESGKEDLDDHNFGGFLQRKQLSDEKNDEPRSKKEIMEDVVANAKLKKHERQVLKEESETKRQKLDEDLDLVRGLLKLRGDESESRCMMKGDDYDKSVREMAFELKAQATDKLKTEEQISRQEEEKLKKLEVDRLRRMKGLPLQKKKPTHRSADDLDDGFMLEVDKRSLLTYQDGEMVMPEQNDSDTEDVSEYEINDSKMQNEEQSEEEDDEEMEGEEEDEDSDGEEDSDLNSSENELSNHDTKPEGSVKQDKLQNISKRPKKPKEILPYTFHAPKSFDEFSALICNRSTEDQLIIIERIQKCNHPKLNPANKAKMECFFDILIQFVAAGKLAAGNPPNLTILDGLVSHIFNLAQHSPLHAAKTMQDSLRKLHQEFCEMSKKRKVPSLNMVLHLRIICLLFPTSDFRHGVCTPALVFMSQILSQMTVHTVQDVLIGLFICNLIYEFVYLSKRYVPEVINYLIGVLYLSSEKQEPLGDVFPPFKLKSKHNNILRTSSAEPCSVDTKPISFTKIFNTYEKAATKDSERISATRACLGLLQKFTSLYNELVSFPEIFAPATFHMKRIKMTNYPQSVQSLYNNAMTSISNHKSERQPLALHTRRPVPIQTFEPKFEERYEVKRKRGFGNKANNESQKLRYKHKKEFKGALREIRKDSQFLARQQLQEQMQRDAERARKTKHLQALLSNQQAEANEFNRKKRKLKK